MTGTRRLVTVADRVEIATGLKAGWSITAIAEHLGRDKSVISREVARNATKTRGYRLVHADCEAQRRRARPQVGKVAASPVLSARVRADLRQGRSPKAIAGRLAVEAADPGLPVAAGSPRAHGERVSHEAMYAYIYALPKGELARHGIMLESKRTRRRPRTPLGQRKAGPIVGMRSIHDRPAEVADRKVPGNWEGDLIIGRAGKSAAATLVERTTRFTAILGLPLGKDSDGLADALIEHTRVLPALFRKSLTWDQGSEMARHAHLTQVTGIDVYFADPHSPWQRGSNENTNRRIRRYLPKGTDITDHQPYLNAIAEELNEMPLRCLGWLTPREAYERLLTSDVASTA